MIDDLLNAGWTIQYGKNDQPSLVTLMKQGRSVMYGGLIAITYTGPRAVQLAHARWQRMHTQQESV